MAEKRRAQQQLNARKKKDYVSLPEGSNLLQNKKRKGLISGPLAAAFNVVERYIGDKQAARMFYASTPSFNLARCPYFRKYSQTLANSKLSGYSPPTSDRLRTTLLAQEKAHVNRKLQPIKDSWKKKGVSICSNGRSYKQKRPLINIMATSIGGAMFMKAIDANGNIKDADYVANIFLSVIEEIGKQNIVQIITDNGSNFKAARLTIERDGKNPGGNGFDIDGSPIEFAELSINEHELELVTFDDAMEKVQPDDVDHEEVLWDTIRDTSKMVKEHVNCGRLEALINQGRTQALEEEGDEEEDQEKARFQVEEEEEVP
ncbi:unnamed protein product [Camellia sinensis]